MSAEPIASVPVGDLCLAPICLFADFMMAVPVLVSALALKRLTGIPDSSYPLVLVALLVSVLADIVGMFQLGQYQWVMSHMYPGIQLGLFAAAVGGMHPALLTAFIVYVLSSGQILVTGIVEPDVIGRVAGSLVVGWLALNWEHPLRPTVLVYCVLGAMAWLLWMPVKDVYGAANTAAYLGYQGTRLAGMALFVWAVYRQEKAPPRAYAKTIEGG